MPEAHVTFVFSDGSELSMTVEYDPEEHGEDYRTAAEFANAIFATETGFNPIDYAIDWSEE